MPSAAGSSGPLSLLCCFSLWQTQPIGGFYRVGLRGHVLDAARSRGCQPTSQVLLPMVLSLGVLHNFLCRYPYAALAAGAVYVGLWCTQATLADPPLQPPDDGCSESRSFAWQLQRYSLSNRSGRSFVQRLVLKKASSDRCQRLLQDARGSGPDSTSKGATRNVPGHGSHAGPLALDLTKSSLQSFNSCRPDWSQLNHRNM